MRIMKERLLLFSMILFLSSSMTAQKKYALLIGISNYHIMDKTNEWNDIHGTNDVALISAVLKKQNFNIDVLTEEKATHSAIIKHLKLLNKKITKGSIVYIQFSCHGQPFEDLDGDEEDGWDESIIPIDSKIEYKKGVYEGQNHITDDVLARYTDALRTKIGNQGKLYVVVDACHAGRASRDFDDKVFIRGTKRGFSPNGKIYKARSSSKTHFNIPKKMGQAPATFLEACKSTQVNSETKKNGKFYGPMSFYIHQVLSSYSLNKNDNWVYMVQDLMRM